MKEKILALAQNTEDRLLLASVWDKMGADYLVHTRFLDLHERALVQQAARIAKQRHVFWGGYPDAERVCAIFLPDYLSEEDAVAEENSPVVLLRAEKKPADQLSHRDYLGGLMGLQISRDTIGDILVGTHGAELLILREMADFISLHFTQTGRKTIHVSPFPLSALRLPVVREIEKEGSVASLRLDSLAALIFSLSRSEVQAMIAKGFVFVNQQPCLKPGHTLSPGDRITVRGKGRAAITALGGTSRKGRQFVHYTRTQ